MFCIRVACVCLVCLLLCKEEDSSPVSFQIRREGIWACMRCPCLCLCWVLGWDYVSLLPCGIMLVLRAVFNMLMRNANLRGPLCFRCLIFSLLGRCELLFLFYCIVLSVGPE